MTTLRDATLDLERGVNDALGDEITYHFADPAGVSATFNAWVEFDSQRLGTSNSSAQTDRIEVEVPMSIVELPAHGDRIEIAVLPGKRFAFSDRIRGGTGATWILPLKRATD